MLAAARSARPSGLSAAVSPQRPHARRCRGIARRSLRLEPFQRSSTPTVAPARPETPPMGSPTSSRDCSDGSQLQAPAALSLCKAWYFLAGASGVFFYPYLNMYLAQAGMSPPTIGLLSALRPWVSAPFAMAATSLADQHRCHRQVLVAAFVASTLLRCSILGAGSAGAMFWLLLVGELLGAPINVIGDSTVLSNCQRDSDFGQQRLWGSLGFGACSLAAGWLIAHSGLDAAFTVFSLLSIPMGVVAWMVPYDYALVARKQQQQALELAFADPPATPASEAAAGRGADTAAAAGRSARASTLRQRQHHNQQQLQEQEGAASTPLPAAAAVSLAPPAAAAKAATAGAAADAAAAGPGSGQQGDLVQVLLQPPVALFLFRAMLMGFGLGVMNTYEFLYLKTLGAPETLMGAAMLVACCTEVPAFRFQGKLLEQVSLDSVVHLVLLTIALRLGLYGALPGWGSVWGVLPVELLHGITYALAFGCGTMYASKVAPPGRGASMQGVFQATYLSIGGGLGGLLGGLLLESHGGAILFTTSAWIVLGGWAAAWAAEVALKQVGKSTTSQQQQAGVAPVVGQQQMALKLVGASQQQQEAGVGNGAGQQQVGGHAQGLTKRRLLGKKAA